MSIAEEPINNNIEIRKKWNSVRIEEDRKKRKRMCSRNIDTN